MILTYLDNAFKLNDKTELKDEKGELVYTCIYDFSYKNRIRILDKANNELAYIQFKVIASDDQIALYDKQDKLLAYLKGNEKTIQDDGYHFEGSINNYKVLNKDNKEIMVVDNNKAIINDDDQILKCIMCLFVYNNLGE